jgi:hypothetical protein
MGVVSIILTRLSELLFVISLLLGDVRESRYRSTHEVVKLGESETHNSLQDINAFFPLFIHFSSVWIKFAI